MPGVLAQRRYGEIALSIRGSGIDQSFHQRGVLFAQDGVPFADADGFADFQKIDQPTARYVEAYRGGNALRFGGAQLAARSISSRRPGDAQSENLVWVEAGSRTSAGAAQLAREWGAWDVFAAITAMQGDGFREQAEQDQLRGTLNLGRSFGADREVRLIVYGADINQEVPGALTLAQALSDPRQANAGSAAFNWQLTKKCSALPADALAAQRLDVWKAASTPHTDLYHPISLLIDQQIETQGLVARVNWEGSRGRRADIYYGVSSAGPCRSDHRAGDVSTLAG